MNSCDSMKYKVKKAVSKAMKEKTEKWLNKLLNHSNGMLRLVRALKPSNEELIGEICMSGSDGKVEFQ